MSAFTENLNLVLPVSGGDRNAWGPMLNTNFNIIDEQLAPAIDTFNEFIANGGTIGGPLLVNGATTIQGDLAVIGNVVANAATLTDLVVSNSVVFSSAHLGDTVIDGTLQVNGVTSLADELFVSRDVTISNGSSLRFQANTGIWADNTGTVHVFTSANSILVHDSVGSIIFSIANVPDIGYVGTINGKRILTEVDLPELEEDTPSTGPKTFAKNFPSGTLTAQHAPGGLDSIPWITLGTMDFNSTATSTRVVQGNYTVATGIIGLGGSGIVAGKIRFLIDGVEKYVTADIHNPGISGGSYIFYDAGTLTAGPHTVTVQYRFGYPVGMYAPVTGTVSVVLIESEP